MLTSDSQGYESRAQVMAAEEQRKARAFTDRLSRLRAEEEARQLKRVRSSTRTRNRKSLTEKQGPEDRETLALTQELEKTVARPRKRNRGFIGVSSGSSVRALQAAPKKPQSANPKPVQAPAGPTPEEYLKGAQCLLAGDIGQLKDTFAQEKRERATVRSRLGALAVLILEVETLATDIEAEQKHRRLEQGPECAKQSVVVELLRSLVGAPARSLEEVDGYKRGATRLRSELEVRAGLPKVR